MAQQISFYRKNYIDISNSIASISEQSSLQENGLSLMRDRSNNTAWITTGSNDAETLQVIFDFVDARDVDSIILIGHNLDSFQIEYDSSGVWTDFATPINESGVTDTTSYYEVTSVNTTRIRLTITGTQVADDEKRIQQAVFTEKLGQLEGWPRVRNARLDQNIQTNDVVSGKRSITRNTGGFRFEASVRVWNVAADIALLENLYLSNASFLVWIASGDEEQFSLKRFGYRNQDIFLMRTSDQYTPNFYKGLYRSGFVLAVSFSEVIN